MRGNRTKIMFLTRKPLAIRNLPFDQFKFDWTWKRNQKKGRRCWYIYYVARVSANSHIEFFVEFFGIYFSLLKVMPILKSSKVLNLKCHCPIGKWSLVKRCNGLHGFDLKLKDWCHLTISIILHLSSLREKKLLPSNFVFLQLFMFQCLGTNLQAKCITF